MEKKNNKSMLAIIAVAALILVIGGTYAFITFVLEGEKQNTITGGSLVVTLDDKSAALQNPAGDLVLEDQFPVSDAVGKTRTPYKFTLTNSSAKDASYTIYLDESAVTGTRMADSKIKIYLTNSDGSHVYQDVATVDSLTPKTRTVNGASVNSRVLYSGVLPHGALDGSGNVVTPTSETFALRMFISSGAGQEIMGQEYATKVSVDAVQVPERAVYLREKRKLRCKINRICTFTPLMRTEKTDRRR